MGCFSALNLQPQVLWIEPRHHVADLYAIADIDDAADDLAGDPEAEIRLVAGAHHAHEVARCSLVLEGKALNLHHGVLLSDAFMRKVVANLDNDLAVQLMLPFDRRNDDALDAAVDQVRERFGSAALTRAVLIGRGEGIEMPLLPD